MRPVPRDTLVDTLVERLRADVLAGRFAPGSYLPPERELSASYGVTRTSLKHAIVRMAQAGLLETRHGVGTRVRDYERLGGTELLPMLVSAVDAGWLPEIFEVRRDVGALVAARAATHADPAHLDRLAELHAELAAAPDAEAAQLAECEIHRVLADAAGNRVYRLLVNTLISTYLEIREAFRPAFTDPPATAALIAPVVTAVRSHAPAAAHEAASAYMLATQHLLLPEDP